MTIRYFDGVDEYNAMQASRYWNSLAGNPGVSATSGRNGGGCFSISGGGISTYFTKTIDNQVTWFVGFAYRVDSLVNNGIDVMSLTDTGNAQVVLHLNVDGTFSVQRGSTVLSTTAFSINTGVWYYLELKTTIDPTVGSYDLHINGVSRTSRLGVNTRNTANNYANGFSFFGVNNGNVYYDDLYFADGNGGQDFLGDVRVETKLPSGNGSVNAFTRGGIDSGVNWGQVNENPANDDTNYVQSGNAGDIDLYTFPALVTTAGLVKAVMSVIVARDDAAGTVTMSAEYKSSTTSLDGGSQNIGSTTYNSYTDIQVNDPATATSWTIAGVNACQFGVKRVL